MNRRIIVFHLFCGIIMFCIMNSLVSEAQIGWFTKEDVIQYTPLWKGERFPDGRPKVPDAIIERMKNVSLEEARSVLLGHGYNNQIEYVEGWLVSNPTNKVLVGRAHTAQFMNDRPEMLEVMRDKGKKAGASGIRPKFWQIDMLVKGDVPVVDMFGKKYESAYMGDDLANIFYENTGGTGAVVDGGCRDRDRLVEKFPDFTIFNRSWNPTSSGTRTECVSINSPIMIGFAVVLPGDVVLGRSEGIAFIPPHLAEEVVDTSEYTALQDQFRLELVRDNPGKYRTNQIHTGTFEPEILALWRDWVKKKGIQLTPFQLELFKKESSRL